MTEIEYNAALDDLKKEYEAEQAGAPEADNEKDIEKREKKGEIKKESIDYGEGVSEEDARAKLKAAGYSDEEIEKAIQTKKAGYAAQKESVGKFADKIKQAYANWQKDFPNVQADADDIANDVAVMIEDEGGTVTAQDFEAIRAEVSGGVEADESIKEGMIEGKSIDDIMDNVMDAENLEIVRDALEHYFGPGKEAEADKVMDDISDESNLGIARDALEMYANDMGESIKEASIDGDYFPTKEEQQAFFKVCTRKAGTWDEIKATNDPKVIELAKKLIVIPTGVLWTEEPEYPLENFTADTPTWFVTGGENANWYLVDTEGFDYARYMVALTGFNVSEPSEAITEKAKKWIQKAFAKAKKKGTTGKCTKGKFGSKTCPAGSKAYNMAKNLRKMAKEGKVREARTITPELKDWLIDVLSSWLTTFDDSGDEQPPELTKVIGMLGKGEQLSPEDEETIDFHLGNKFQSDADFDDDNDRKMVGAWGDSGYGDMTEGKVPDVSKDNVPGIIKDLLEKHGLAEGK